MSRHYRFIRTCSGPPPPPKKVLFFRWVRKTLSHWFNYKNKSWVRASTERLLYADARLSKEIHKVWNVHLQASFHLPSSFRLKAFPTCCSVVGASGVTSNPWCDTIHLSPLQFAADFLSFIYGYLRGTADGRGQQMESLTYHLWFTILIPRELQSCRGLGISRGYLDIIMKSYRWNEQALLYDSGLRLSCLLQHCWQIQMLWTNAIWALTSAGMLSRPAWI